MTGGAPAVRRGGAPRRALELAGHPAVVGLLAATLVAGVAWLRWQGIPPADLVGVQVVRLWSAALAVTLLARLGSASLSGRAGAALAALGLLALLAHGWRVALGTSRATLDLGVGEQATGWAGVEEGRPGPPPPLTLEAVPAGPEGRFVVALADRRTELLLGAQGALGDDLTLRITGCEAAPLVSALTEQGEVLDQVLAKVRLAAARTEYVELGELPHRFYLASGSPVTCGVTPDRLQLRIQRGKLTVRRLEVLKDHGIRFDGRIFKFQDGAAWATLEVTRRTGAGLAWLGAALLGAAALLTLTRRR